MKSLYLFILLLWIARTSSESPARRRFKRIPAVDALIQSLEGEAWADDENCVETTLQILKGVKNDTLWATWVWESMQPPVGVFYGSGVHLGNYDQCLNAPWPRRELRTQYCLVQVRVQDPMERREFGSFDSADEYLNTLSIPGRTFNNLGFGVCMPAVCSPSSVTKFFRHMLRTTHLPDPELITIDPDDCQTADQAQYPGKFYVFLSVFAALMVIVVASTVYIHFKDERSLSTVDSIIKSFSMIHNWNDLFKVNKNEIGVLNGMRVITAMLVIGCHQTLFCLYEPTLISNGVEADVMFKDEIGQGITHLDLIVDTFFSISGLLLIRGLSGGRQKNLIVVLIKRYIRLIGPYAAATFYIMCMARHTASGPVWPRANADEEGVCEKHWWKNFLMLGYDMKTMCYGIAWYVTCDYHLAIVTVVLFWIYRRSTRSGLIAFALASFGLTAQLALKAYIKNLPLVPFNNVNEIADIRQHGLMNELYIRWHDRAGSYFVGVAMGYFMTLYKPAEYRNSISKRTSFVIVLTSLFVMVKAATINHWLTDVGPVAVAIAIATNRAAWAMAICGIIAACEYGSAGVIRDFLSCALFVPLSKLTYGIYMTHFFLIQRNIHTVRSSFKFDTFNVVVCVLGTSILASATGLVLYMLLEAPCMNLSNVFLSERIIEAEPNTTKPANGSIHQNGTKEVTKLKTT